jgi:drug/metabolite transporter (DMT)-like permease
MAADRGRDRPWRSPDVVLLGINVVYASSYVATRLTLGDVPPATLALVRCAVGAVLLVPLVLRRPLAAPVAAGDRWRIAAMGVLGFGAAFAFAHWGLLRSTAANAALLIIVEPIAIIALSPLLLGERLRPREVAGAALALVGTTLVVLDGIPGVTTRLAPHWRGDVLLMASGLAFASYSLIGRDVLRRHPATPVTVLSIAWGAAALLPLAGLEWWAGARPRWTAPAVAGTLYLTVVITALAYMVWNWALERVPAPRAAVFLNVQPVAGTLLGVLVLGDAFTVFTAAGGTLIVAGLSMTARAG